jgi:uncharacterized membrane protein
MMMLHRFPRRAQRGATVVMMALVMSTVALSALVSVDVGYLFFQQRKLQSIADMAALAAVQSIPDRVSVAEASASANGFAAEGTVDQITTTAGYWDPALVTTAPHFTETIPANATANAVRIEVQKQNSTFFAGMVAALSNSSRPVLHANAIARIDTTIGISLGTGVARLSDVSPLNQTLSALLGTTVSLDLASYQGLADANIRLGDIMAELGVATVNDLINLDTQVARVVDAALKVASREGLLRGSLASPGAATTLVAGIRNLAVRVATNAGSSTASVLSIAALLGNKEAAADAQVNVLDLITTAAQVANASAGIQISNLGIDLGPLAKVTVQTRIITPPVLAIGPAGTVQTGPRAGQWHTVARSAAARVRLVVEAVDVGLVKVTMPLDIDVAPATAWVASAQCSVPREDSQVSIGVDTGLSTACIAQLPASMATAYNCATQPKSRIAAITLPLLPSIGIDIKASVPLDTATQTLEFSGDEIGVTKTVAQRGLGQTLANALFGPSSALEIVALGIPLGLIGDVITTVLRPLLYPVLLLLDTILTPVLGMLGVQLGFSDVKLTSISCNRPVLVF